MGGEAYTAAKRAVTKLTKRQRLAGGEDGPPILGQPLLDALRLKHLPGWEGPTAVAERRNYLSEEARRVRAELRGRGADVVTEARAVECQKEYDTFMEGHTQLLRELFGNPFRPVALDLTWRSPATLHLAQAAYDERDLPSGSLDPARLAVLADALESAGCDSAETLDHLRGPGPHVRGCWALDLLLGKT